MDQRNSPIHQTLQFNHQRSRRQFLQGQVVGIPWSTLDSMSPMWTCSKSSAYSVWCGSGIAKVIIFFFFFCISLQCVPYGIQAWILNLSIYLFRTTGLILLSNLFRLWGLLCFLESRLTWIRYFVSLLFVKIWTCFLLHFPFVVFILFFHDFVSGVSWTEHHSA